MGRSILVGLLCAVSAVCGLAQSLPSTSAVLPASPGSDLTPRATCVSLYWENDGGYTKPIDASDRHYTAGVGLSLQWQSGLTDSVVGMIPSFGDEFAPGRAGVSYAGGVVASMRMFSPTDVKDPDPR